MRDLGCPECRWIPVVDADGRRRLEMRWQLSGAGTAVAATATTRAA
jgi:hypothetical protein